MAFRGRPDVFGLVTKKFKKRKYEELANFQREALFEDHDAVTPGQKGFKEFPNFFDPEKKTLEDDIEKDKKKKLKTMTKEERKRRLMSLLDNETEYNSRPLLNTHEADEFPKMEDWQEDLCGSHPFRCLYVGASGTGKTVKFIYDLQTIFRHFFDKVVVFSPNLEVDPAWKDAVNIEGHVKMDFDRIEKLRNENRKRAEEAGRSYTKPMLVVIDDFAADKTIARSPKLAEYGVRLRHDGISVIFLSQVYKLVLPTYRKSVTTLHIWNPPNREEAEILAEDCCPSLMDKKEFFEMLTGTTMEKYTYLTIHMKNPPHSRFLINNVTPVDITEYIHDSRINKSQGLRNLIARHRQKFQEFVEEHGTSVAMRDSKGEFDPDSHPYIREEGEEADYDIKPELWNVRPSKEESFKLLT